MEKHFLFMEEGSIEYPYLRKFLENSGLTDANLIQYKKGTPKPELVSIENNEQISEIEIMKKTNAACKTIFLEALRIYLLDNTERHAYMEPSPEIMSYKPIYKTIYYNTIDDFMEKFEDFLKTYKG